LRERERERCTRENCRGFIDHKEEEEKTLGLQTVPGG